MTGPIEIRQARPGDGEAIARIYNQGIAERQATFETEPRTDRDVLTWLRLGDRFPVLVALGGDGEVVGWARISPYSERAAYRGVGELRVYGDRAHRRRGVASRLLGAMAAEAGRRGYWKLLGRLFTSNQASRTLMHRFGFRDVGVHLRHGTLDGEWRDVLVMELLLVGATDHSNHQRSSSDLAPG